jgi:hypothetical protein
LKLFNFIGQSETYGQMFNKRADVALSHNYSALNKLGGHEPRPG